MFWEFPRENFETARKKMVSEQIEARGIRDRRVLRALEKVERHRFVSESDCHHAYADHPVGIGLGQTISQPYIVAFMTEVLALEPSDRVLEIGTGSGYQTAVLAELAAEVFSIERFESLLSRAKECLQSSSYRNIHLRLGNGISGWPEAAPFNKMMVTAACERIYPDWVSQLSEGGRLIAPVGVDEQRLVLAEKQRGKLAERDLLDVRFVLLQTD